MGNILCEIVSFHTMRNNILFLNYTRSLACNKPRFPLENGMRTKSWQLMLRGELWHIFSRVKLIHVKFIFNSNVPVLQKAKFSCFFMFDVRSFGESWNNWAFIHWLWCSCGSSCLAHISKMFRLHWLFLSVLVVVYVYRRRLAFRNNK